MATAIKVVGDIVAYWAGVMAPIAEDLNVVNSDALNNRVIKDWKKGTHLIDVDGYGFGLSREAIDGNDGEIWCSGTVIDGTDNRSIVFVTYNAARVLAHAIDYLTSTDKDAPRSSQKEFDRFGVTANIRDLSECIAAFRKIHVDIFKANEIFDQCVSETQAGRWKL